MQLILRSLKNPFYMFTKDVERLCVIFLVLVWIENETVERNKIAFRWLNSKGEVR